MTNDAGSPWAALFDPGPSVLALVCLLLRQPLEVWDWLYFTPVPGYRQLASWTQATCLSLTFPRRQVGWRRGGHPWAHDPTPLVHCCHPTAGTHKPRHQRATQPALAPVSTLGEPPHLDAACLPTWELGAALSARGSLSLAPSGWFLVHSKPLETWVPSLLGSALGLCPPLLPCESHMASRHFSVTLAAGQENGSHLAQEGSEGGSGPSGIGHRLWSPSCQLGGRPGAEPPSSTDEGEPKGNCGRDQTPPSASPALAPASLLYNMTELPHYLIKLSEPLICAMYLALFFSLSFLSRFNKP